MRRKEGLKGRLTRKAIWEAETDALVVTIVEVIEAEKTLAERNEYGMCRAYLLCCWIMRTLFVESRYCMPSHDSVYHCSHRQHTILRAPQRQISPSRGRQ